VGQYFRAAISGRCCIRNATTHKQQGASWRYHRLSQSADALLQQLEFKQGFEALLQMASEAIAGRMASSNEIHAGNVRSLYNT
jgi:hypothetical protein